MAAGPSCAPDAHAFEPFLPAGGDALRELDVTLLGVALERLAGVDADAVAAGAIAFDKSAADAVAAVERGDGPTPPGCSRAPRSPRSRPSPATAT